MTDALTFRIDGSDVSVRTRGDNIVVEERSLEVVVQKDGLVAISLKGGRGTEQIFVARYIGRGGKPKLVVGTTLDGSDVKGRLVPRVEAESFA